MLFPRFFSPSLNYRLFDPMPLPKRVRVRVRVADAPMAQARAQELTKYRSPFSRIIKKIPENR